VTMISCGVEISIAGGGGEMVCAYLLLGFFYFLFFIFYFNFISCLHCYGTRTPMQR